MITYRNLGRHGRLGNQLFQIASTIGIALDHSDAAVFPADWVYRPFFSFPDIMFMDEIPHTARESTEFAQHLDPRARPYLQDISLFWNHIYPLRYYLQPSARAIDTLVEMKIPNCPRIGIHVRRGDNVVDPGVPNKSDYHLCPSLDYYQRGLKELAPVAFSNSSYICVSDDIPWCKENIYADYYGEGTAMPKEHEPTFLSTVPRDWIDLFTLTACDYLVISGSTFGIWGALMANTPHVVRPDKIYGPIVAAYTDSELIFPKEWKVIPCS
jgi:hypothetical protein